LRDKRQLASACPGYRICLKAIATAGQWALVLAIGQPRRTMRSVRRQPILAQFARTRTLGESPNRVRHVGGEMRETRKGHLIERGVLPEVSPRGTEELR
jgi:hypothetical protein